MSKAMVDEYKEMAIDDYEAWLEKAPAGKVKKSGEGGKITALDEAENRAMYDLYVAEAKAQNVYNKAMQQNEQSRAKALRENAIMKERALDYAQRRAALNGMANTGMSQTAMIDLYSQFAGNSANTREAYDNQRNDIVKEYQNAIMAAENNARNVSTEAGIRRAERDEEIRKSQSDILLQALADYEANGALDKKGWKKLMDSYRLNKDYLDSESDWELINDVKTALSSRPKSVNELPFVLNSSDMNDMITWVKLTYGEEIAEELSRL